MCMEPLNARRTNECEMECERDESVLIMRVGLSVTSEQGGGMVCEYVCVRGRVSVSGTMML